MANNAKLHLEILRDKYNDKTEANVPRLLYEDTFDYSSHDGKKGITMTSLNEFFFFRSSNACLL